MGLISYAQKTYYRFTLVTGVYMLNTNESIVLHAILGLASYFAIRYFLKSLV
jgi:hypothetical protein